MQTTTYQSSIGGGDKSAAWTPPFAQTFSANTIKIVAIDMSLKIRISEFHVGLRHLKHLPGLFKCVANSPKIATKLEWTMDFLAYKFHYANVVEWVMCASPSTLQVASTWSKLEKVGHRVSRFSFHTLIYRWHLFYASYTQKRVQ